MVKNARLFGDSGPARAVCGDVRSRQWPLRPAVPITARQPAGLAALPHGDHGLRAMSRPSSVSPRPPAPGGGGGGGPAQCGPRGGGRAKGLKDIRIDEEVKIAVNIALERFRYGDQRGEVPVRDPAGCPPLQTLTRQCEGAAPEEGGKTWPAPRPRPTRAGLGRDGALGRIWKPSRGVVKSRAASC